MTSYNSEYENYYNSMIKDATKNKQGFFNKKILVRRIIQELSGGLVLFIFLIMLKTGVFPESKAVYSYSKQVVHENYDFKTVTKGIKAIKNTKPEEFQKKINTLVNEIENILAK